MVSEFSSFSPLLGASRNRSDHLIYASIALTAVCVLPIVALSNSSGLNTILLARIALCSLWLLAAYLPAILYSALLLGVCPAAIQTAMTIAVLGALVWAEDSGRIGGIRAFVQNTTNFNFALGAAVACVASLVVASVHQRAVSENLKLLEKSRRELHEAHLETTRFNQQLECRVEQRTRELEETIGDLESFNYTVAHDLRTPLRAINGYASALLQDCSGKLDREGRHMLQRIAAAALRLDTLQSALLKLGRIGVRPIERRRIDLSAVAHRVIERLRKSGAASNTRFVVAASLDAECDPSLAPALLGYILENAVKFSAGRQHPCVEFGHAASATGGKFFVPDNGVGFNQSYHKNLFQPFHQLHARSESQGIGIGLACARRIVERHRGALWAESREDGGATFFFTLSHQAGTASA